MWRWLVKVITLTALVVGSALGVWVYERRRSTEARLQEQVRQLEEQRQHLQSLVARLTASRRRAELVVIEQEYEGSASGGRGSKVKSTTLLFSELAPDGSRLPPRFFTIRGNVVYVDTLVIKFEREFIEKDDPLRGHSLALFLRLFGQYQAPADGFRIDDPDRPPEVYRDSTPRSQALREFEAQLWKDFWQIAQDPGQRAKLGIRAMHGEAPWWYMYPDTVYTVTIEADGGLTIIPRPMDDLFRQYQEALRKQRP
jgi:hypothetical protein